MKKLLIGLCFLCASTPSMAAGANKMTMVTYFPVKYVAYSQVDVMKQMDVGLTSACQMNLGCSADEGFNTGKSLRVNNLLKIAGGKLELNDAPAIEGSTAHIGSGNGVSDFDFKTSLRVGNYKQGYTMQTDNMYLSELNLFGYKFPACSGETMSWQKLKLKNKEEVYLVCGEVEQGSDTCDMTSRDVLYRAQCCEMGAHNPNWKKGIWSTDTCSCTCPTGTTLDEEGACVPESYCGDAIYRAAHKSECCPSVSESDPVCYTLAWREDCEALGDETICEQGGGDFVVGSSCDSGTCSSSEWGQSCTFDWCSGGVIHRCETTCDIVRNGW